KYLCAYLVPLNEDAPRAGGLEPNPGDYLADFLPDHMIPAFFVELETIPLTANGKIDYGSLPAPTHPDLAEGEGHVAPRNVVETEMVKLWAEVLGIDESVIGIDSNFFQLGGHSLTATVLAARVHQTLHVNLPLSQLFKTPRVRALAEYINGLEEEGYESIEPAEKKDYHPLSSAQKRLYILYQMDTGSTAYNMPQFIPLGSRREWSVDQLERIFIALINRHESLRTSFHMIHNQPVQRVHDHVDFRMELFGKGDPLWSPPHGNMDSDKGSHGGLPLQSERAFIRPFDLSRAPLLRVGLSETGAGKRILKVDMHHIISDGVSLSVLGKDFTALVEGKSLPPLRIRYKDFAQWQNSRSEKEKIARQEAFWIEEFSAHGEIPVIQLPVDYPRPAVQSFDGSSVTFGIPARDAQALKKAALENNSTLFMLLMAVTAILLSKLSGQEDIVIGTPIAGRRHADLQKIIGMFVNTLALRHYPAGEKTCDGFLREVNQRTLKAFENQEYPFEDLVERLPVERDTGRNPLFDVMFMLNNTGANVDADVDAGVDAAAKFDLTIAAVETGETLEMVFQYRTRLFKKETVQRFPGYFKRIVTSIVETPDIKLADMEIISTEEKQQLLVEFNDTRRDYPRDKTIAQLFEEQAEKEPHRIAIIHSSSCLSYGELNKRAAQLAALMRRQGVAPGLIAAVMMGRSLEMMIGIFGILKAGAAYLPIDPGYPEERKNYILRDSNAIFCISDEWEKGIENNQLSIFNYQLLMKNS
ncbi:MAG: AMP-binding protein, partial [bacterium]|nr:AMP-binding protein [bacterium]